LRGRLVEFLSLEIRETLPIYLMILFYTLVFSFVTVTKFYSLRTYAYDLGNYNQALYTTLRGYGLLYYTSDLPVTGGSMMGVHFCPILLLILPIYALYPTAPNLLVLQSFILALGALPIYKLARYLLKERFWGILFSATYLLNPMLQGINWFDFHPEAFFPTFCLFSLYYGLKKDWLKYVLFSILTLTTTQYSAILVFVMSLYFLWIHNKRIKDSLQVLRNLNLRNIHAHSKYPLTTMILSIVWFFIALQVVSMFSPGNPLVKGGATQWSILGADDTLSIPLKLVTSPGDAFAALMYDWPLKRTYLLILFGSTAFLTFLSPKSLILTLPWLTASLLSNYTPFYHVGDQYPAFLVPFVTVGAILGAKRLVEYASQKHLPFDIHKMLAIFLLISSLIFSILSSPLYGHHMGTWTDITYGLEPITEHDRIVTQILSLIPQNASIITQQNIFPLVSSRTNSFVFPIGSFYPPGSDFNTTLIQWLQHSDFVLVDMKTSLFETYLAYAYIEHFGVYASNDGVILLKRNYCGEPVLFEPYHVSIDWEDLWLISGETVLDQNSSSQKVLLRRAHTGPVNDFWHGPPVYLPPGEYKATFKLKVTNKLLLRIIRIGTSGFPLKLDIMELGTETSGHRYSFLLKYFNSTIVYASRELWGSDFSKTNVYKEFSLTFSLNLPAALEFSGTDVSDNTDLYLDRIQVTQLSPSP
jgi:uncharacterized membrane protein